MNIKIILSPLVLIFLLLPLNTQATITWGESITAGSTTLKASHMNELRAEIEALRTDVDGGSGADDLGNHTATTNINVSDRALLNVRHINGKDYDDDTGGADNKYRLLHRDGVFMVPPGSSYKFSSGGTMLHVSELTMSF